MKSYWDKVGPSWVFTKRENLDTDIHIEKTPCEEEDGDLPAKEYQRLPVKHQKLEESMKESPLQPSEGNNSAGTLILDFWPRELRQSIFVV